MSTGVLGKRQPKRKPTPVLALRTWSLHDPQKMVVMGPLLFRVMETHFFKAFYGFSPVGFKGNLSLLDMTDFFPGDFSATGGNSDIRACPTHPPGVCVMFALTQAQGLQRIPTPGSPTRPPSDWCRIFYRFFFGWEDFPTKKDHGKKGTLIRTSLLDLAKPNRTLWTCEFILTLLFSSLPEFMDFSHFWVDHLSGNLKVSVVFGHPTFLAFQLLGSAQF